MQNVEFNIGDKVVVIKDGELRKGVIKNFFPITPPVVVVEFADGIVEKIPYDKIAKEPIEETSKPQNEPTEKKEITITSDEFTKVAASVLADELRNEPFIGLLVATIISKIQKVLFTESQDRDIFLN